MTTGWGSKRKVLFQNLFQGSQGQNTSEQLGMADAKLTFRHGVEIPKRRCFETLLRSVTSEDLQHIPKKSWDSKAFTAL